MPPTRQSSPGLSVKWSSISRVNRRRQPSRDQSRVIQDGLPPRSGNRTQPLKKRVAKDQLEATVLHVADETLELIFQIKGTFYSLEASQQLLQQLKLIVDTNAASLDLAQRQHEAGNIADLALAQQQAAYDQSRLDVAAAEAEILRNRERLNRQLGLWGIDTGWKISGALPEVPGSEVSMSGLERLALSQRLDLQADYVEVTSQAKNLGLAKDFRLLGALDFGIESERETDSQIRTGPSFAIELPIFNQGQARIARGEAALRQAQDKFEALAIDVRSQIRELRDELVSKRTIAQFYHDELLPVRRRILNESLLNYNAMAIGNYELFATGWYENPPGTLAALASNDELERDLDQQSRTNESNRLTSN
jgi:outer membrane protein, heavy metal efflux system